MYQNISKMIDEKIKAGNIINELELDIPIYKFIPFKYISSLLDGVLCINKIDSWEDVYENFLFKQHFALEDGTPIKADNLAKCNFGQSWTKADETDAMWRIYSDVSKCQELSFCRRCSSFFLKESQLKSILGNVAIRIKTTARKLFDSVYTDDACMSNTYIGQVKYKSSDEIEEWLISNRQLNVNELQRTMAESLFIKRKEFEHEHEVRIAISFSENDKMVKSTMLRYSIEPESFIDEMLIDPRLFSSSFSRIIKKQLINMGMNESKIKVSSLYKFCPISTSLILG